MARRQRLEQHIKNMEREVMRCMLLSCGMLESIDNKLDTYEKASNVLYPKIFDQQGRILKMPIKKMKRQLKKDYKFCMTWELELEQMEKKSILSQSILGHMQNGHGKFKEKNTRYIYPYASMGLVEAGLGRNPQALKLYRQEQMEEVRDCFLTAIQEKQRYMRLVNKKNEPLLGIEGLGDYEYLTEECCRAAALMGRLDSHYWRRKTVETYKTSFSGEPLQIGSGSTQPVNIRVLFECKLDAQFLAIVPQSEEQMDFYRSIGLVVQNGAVNDKDVEPLYIRHVAGPGCSDDMALLYIGKRVRLSENSGAVKCGVVTDALDTLDKFTAVLLPGGFDEFFAEEIAEKWKETYGTELVTSEMTMEMIYMAAKANTPKVAVSSSHRRLVQKQPGMNITTYQMHEKYLDGEIIETGILDMKRISSGVFYRQATERFKRLEAMLRGD
ncbi:MAG: hypothetical protein QXK37_05375 [Candidatus Woesearchaeota archaeon]